MVEFGARNGILALRFAAWVLGLGLDVAHMDQWREGSPDEA